MGQVAPQAQGSSTARRSPLGQAIERLCNGPLKQNRRPRGPQLDDVSIWRDLEARIEETILPRELTINVDGIASARLFVSRRRLRAIHVLAPVEGHLNPSPATVAEFAQVIDQICSKGRIFTLHTTGKGEQFRDLGPGCTSQQLLQARQCVTLTSDIANQLNVMISISDATLICDVAGQEQLSLGAENLLEPLRRVKASEDDIRTAHHKPMENGRNTRPTCLVLPFKDEIRILSATVDAQRAFFAVREEHLDTALAACQTPEREI